MWMWLSIRKEISVALYCINACCNHLPCDDLFTYTNLLFIHLVLGITNHCSYTTFIPEEGTQKNPAHKQTLVYV